MGNYEDDHHHHHHHHQFMMFLPGSALAEYAIILSIYTLELDKREYQINQASQMMMMMMMIYGNIDISILLLLLCH